MISNETNSNNVNINEQNQGIPLEGMANEDKEKRLEEKYLQVDKKEVRCCDKVNRHCLYACCIFFFVIALLPIVVRWLTIRGINEARNKY